MQITLDWLREKEACSESMLRFKHTFPEGAEYQDVLDALAKENKADWAAWLMKEAGSTNDVLEVESLEVECSLFFAGQIKIKGLVKIAKWLLAGGGIEA
ncbi:MAG TPA: hypothetical protein DCZ10_12465, partial [Pelotomaculum sp.]|nr:hypothetical protein [Pelotomaculum sp.]HBK53210.1 hypothetical protein [Syntrophomonas wolfei]